MKLIYKVNVQSFGILAKFGNILWTILNYKFAYNLHLINKSQPTFLYSNINICLDSEIFFENIP